VALFRAGQEDAFRVIHDRYRQRLFAYTRQMLADRQDAEDALQDIFVRAYAGLRANHRELALRAWLYRVAHNRCVDELRRPAPPPPEVIELLRSPVHDPIAQADQRESLRRLIADVRRLPDQQRSALLMRELGGMSYADMACALGVSIPAVKSLLVRARLGLAQALQARDTACSEIREELILADDRGRRPNGMARRHMRDCAGCREFRHDLRGVSRRFAALVPTLGPLGVLANLLGLGGAGGGALGGSGAVGGGGALAGGGAVGGGGALAGGGAVGGTGAAAGGGALAAGGAAGGGSALVSVGALGAGAGHVATLLAAAVVTAGGAVGIQHTIAPPAHPHQHRVRAVPPAPHHARAVQMPIVPAGYSSQARTVTPAVITPPTLPVAPAAPAPAAPASHVRVPQPVVSTRTTTTTITIKTKPSGGSSGTGSASATSTPPTKPTTASSGSASSSASGTTTSAGASTARTGQAPTVSPASAPTSATGSTGTSASSSLPVAGTQTTIQGTGSPGSYSTGESPAPQQ
jgi:RNA polymerase sigma factor (sigma-70 family)